MFLQESRKLSINRQENGKHCIRLLKCYAKQRELLFFLKVVGWYDTIYNYVYLKYCQQILSRSRLLWPSWRPQAFITRWLKSYPILPSRRNILKGSELKFYEILRTHTQIQEIKAHFPPSINSTAIINSQGVFLITRGCKRRSDQYSRGLS